MENRVGRVLLVDQENQERRDSEAFGVPEDEVAHQGQKDHKV